MFKGGFIQNLPKIYGLYTGGFLVFILMMAIAEQAGVTAKTIGICFYRNLIYVTFGQTKIQTFVIQINEIIHSLPVFLIF